MIAPALLLGASTAGAMAAVAVACLLINRARPGTPALRWFAWAAAGHALFAAGNVVRNSSQDPALTDLALRATACIVSLYTIAILLVFRALTGEGGLRATGARRWHRSIDVALIAMLGGRALYGLVSPGGFTWEAVTGVHIIDWGMMGAVWAPVGNPDPLLPVVLASMLAVIARIGWMSFRPVEVLPWTTRIVLAVVPAAFLVAAVHGFGLGRGWWGGGPVGEYAMATTVCVLAVEIIRRERLALRAERERDLRLSAIMDQGMVMVALIDTHGRLLTSNRAALQQAGVGPHEVIGRHLADTPWWTHDPGVCERLHAAIARGVSGTRDRFLTTHRAADGSLHDIDFSLTPYRDEHGQVLYCIAEGRDVTELVQAQRRLQESQERLMLAMEATQDAIWDWHLPSGVTYYSPRWYTMLGYRPDEFPPGFDTWQRLTHPDDVTAAMPAIEAQLAARGAYEVEFRMRHADGGWRWILGRGRVVSRDEVGKAVRLIGTNVDLTPRKAAEEALRQANQQLERRVAERTAELREALVAADAANQAKSRFLANMSHEIRTPMHAVLGFAQLLHRDASLDPGQRERIASILRAGDHLLGLIEDVLDMSRIEAGVGVLRPAPMRLDALVESVAGLIRERAAAKGLGFRTSLDRSLPPVVVGDAGRLRQILINLLGNAVRFTEAGEVVLTIDAGTGACVRFAVSDTGPGIDPVEFPALFRPFEQTATGRKRQGGTGLGLAISQGHARQMGSEIMVESRPGQGAVFRFAVDLPAAPGGTDDLAVAPPRRLMPGSTWRVLVVDDVAPNRLLLREMLVDAGFTVDEAADGRAGLDRIAVWRPHLVLLDMRMPVLDGQGVLAALAGTADRPRVIALTASTLPEERAAVIAAGADDFLGKPFREADLLAVLARNLPAAIWQAATPAQPSTPASPDPGASARLDAGLRSALVEAARAADVDALTALMPRLTASEPALAAAVAACLATYRHDRILAMIGPA